MNQSYDLHTHSLCSDGALVPEALVKLAHQQGVDVLALTDHDTLSGVQTAKDEVTRINQTHAKPISIISGIELSAQWKGRNIHIVGLCLDLSSTCLQQGVEQQRLARLERAHEIARRLEKKGISNAWAGAAKYAQDDHIGRPHFAQYLVDVGAVSNINQAFQKYLGSGKIGDVKQHWPSVEEVVEWVNAAEGIAVVAHPNKYDLTRTKLYELLETFAAAGGQGIEVVSGMQNKNITDKLVRAACDFSLAASCGSDFHSDAWQMVGKMSPMPTPPMSSDYKTVWELPQFSTF